jgi:nitrile hydratase
MNGIHDMGGMHNLGPLEIEADEPVFHEPWEGRVFGLLMCWGPWARSRDFGNFRYALEQIDPADYLSWSYYHKWFAAYERKALESGLVTRRELDRGQADPALPVPTLAPYDPPQLGSRRLDAAVKAALRPGDRVRAKNLNPAGHIRLPRYARGRVGEVVTDHGVYALQDTDTRGVRLGNTPQHVYSVRFSARELWGEAGHPRDVIHLDLWEGYLEKC